MPPGQPLDLDTIHNMWASEEQPLNLHDPGAQELLDIGFDPDLFVEDPHPLEYSSGDARLPGSSNTSPFSPLPVQFSPVMPVLAQAQRSTDAFDTLSTDLSNLAIFIKEVSARNEASAQIVKDLITNVHTFAGTSPGVGKRSPSPQPLKKKKKKEKKVRACSYCGKSGHNRRGCIKRTDEIEVVAERLVAERIMMQQQQQQNGAEYAVAVEQ